MDRAGPGEPWRSPATALAALATAVAAGVLVALAGWLAGGAVGGGRMARLGPSFACGAVAGGWFAVLVVPGALAVRWWLLRRTASDGPGPDAELDELELAVPGLGGVVLGGVVLVGRVPTARVLADRALDELDRGELDRGGLDRDELDRHASDLDGEHPGGRGLAALRARSALAVRRAALRLRPGRDR